ncbi:MAG TPA: hypothetical protein PK325_16865 [Cyclobacteriaceae bacterium]|nr:hypothetical protein [Cyclobacteriaceae bacterium]HMV08877.1 hypothetical protein [Cyclobacteriaceae bacterium]HMV89302.1 hypothetical protein [Cyclobacteriaceae bacterium]HMX00368.1 hypothetical protein [Cyclobacteriaceae bacterium]HMX49633.1 hypothetical protein [Cyclobacteriaceae bacterium]
MKKIVWAFLLLIATHGYGQDVKRITDDYNAYSKLLAEKSFEKAFDYLNPGIFDIAPKAQLLEVMNQTLNNPAITLEVSNPEVSEFSEVKKIGETYYVKFKTFNIIKMKFNGLFGSDKTPEEIQATTQKMKESFDAKFGAGNVSYDEKTQFFQIKATKPVIASSADKTSWKFITIDDDSQKPMLSQFIPAELLN